MYIYAPSSEFLNLPKFKWLLEINIIIFCGPKNYKKVIQVLQSHYPPYVNVQVILLEFKMATTSLLLNYFNYLWAQKLESSFMTGDDMGLQAYCLSLLL